MLRALGIDFGDKRIGLAVCDDAGRLAVPFELVKRVGDRSVEHGRILALATEVTARYLVVGIPLNLDGSIGPVARAVQSEVRGLRKRIQREGLDLTVVEHDERLSTVEAHRGLARGGVSTRDRRELVDASAAAVILQAWLEAQPPDGRRQLPSIE
ncbi:MAG: Holliday junction resolvase RuvX [Actinomycetota bacterium]|nr:Holliday junction resolvase RuvX [Actinomycetota bacterium]